MKRRLQPRQARWLCSKLLAVLQVLSGAPCKAHFLRGMARHGVLLHIFGAETASTNLSPPPTKSPSRRDADLQLDFVPGMHLEPPQCALCWSFCTSTVCAHPGVPLAPTSPCTKWVRGMTIMRPQDALRGVTQGHIQRRTNCGFGTLAVRASEALRLHSCCSCCSEGMVPLLGPHLVASNASQTLISS